MKILKRLQVSRILMFTMMFSMVFSPLVQTFKVKVEAAAPQEPVISYSVMAAGPTINPKGFMNRELS